LKISCSVRRYLVAIVLIASAVRVKAEIRLPRMLSDEAVLQRDRPIHLWGWSTPGARIAAHFHKQTVAAKADAIGRWSLYLQPESAGGPFVLTLTGDGDTRTLNDMLVGDVWLASGQSNMEFPLQGFGAGTSLKNQAAEIANANHPNVRLLRLEPPDKQTVGARLALAARSNVYGESVPYSGPAFREATPLVQPDGTTAMRVWFDHAEDLSFHGKPVSGFELAGPDHKFIPADARIQENTVLVSTPALPNPTYVRYGWASVVPDSLYNAAGLPASTFTSEPTPLR
jgi:hypothetical protein